MKTKLLLMLVAGLLTACGEDKPEAPKLKEIEMNALMERHYNSAIFAHDALIRGDLRTMRKHLDGLTTATLPEGAPEAWKPLQEALRNAAKRGAGVTDLAAGATAMAELIQTCGTCHSSVASSPEYGMPPPPKLEERVATGMSRHQWQTERLWEGITGPRDDAWMRGAEGVAASKIFDNLGTGDFQSRLRSLESELRALGAEAKTTTDLSKRVGLYGRLLATCATCHRAAGKLFAPTDVRPAVKVKGF